MGQRRAICINRIKYSLEWALRKQSWFTWMSDRTVRQDASPGRTRLDWSNNIFHGGMCLSPTEAQNRESFRSKLGLCPFIPSQETKGKGVLPRGGLDASEGTEFPAVDKDASRYRTWAIPHPSPRTGFPGSESSITKLLIWLPVWLLNGREHAIEPSLFIQLACLRVLFF